MTYPDPWLAGAPDEPAFAEPSATWWTEGSAEDGSYRLEDEIVAVGKAIRTLRKEKGLSLRELSRLAGLSTSFLSMVERGRSSLALTSLNNVAKALDTELADLFASERKVRVSHPLPHVSRAKEDGRLSITSSQRV